MHRYILFQTAQRYVAGIPETYRYRYQIHGFHIRHNPVFGCVLTDGKMNVSFIRSEFDGIGNNVDEYLVEAGSVTDDIRIGNADILCEVQVLFGNLTADHCEHPVNQLIQIDFGFIKGDLSALNTAHVQNVVDQRKQIITG